MNVANNKHLHIYVTMLKCSASWHENRLEFSFSLFVCLVFKMQLSNFEPELHIPLGKTIIIIIILKKKTPKLAIEKVNIKFTVCTAQNW